MPLWEDGHLSCGSGGHLSCGKDTSAVAVEDTSAVARTPQYLVELITVYRAKEQGNKSPIELRKCVHKFLHECYIRDYYIFPSY